jgi:hypothetical protein
VVHSENSSTTYKIEDSPCLDVLKNLNALRSGLIN